MADNERDVKQDSGVEVGRWYVRVWANCQSWFDGHPRLGWYLAGIGVLNVVLNLLQILLQLFG